jgi:hypothetical protein
MTNLVLILKFFGGLILLFIFGIIVGHLFKLDKYYKDIFMDKKEESQKHNYGND